MYYLVYTSHASADYGEKHLEQLLFQAQQINSSQNITGLLLYFDRRFMQVLEGEEKVVKRLFRKIKQDERHHTVKIVIEGHIAERNYPDWSMGYKALFPEEIMYKLGYRDPEQYFENHPITEESHVTSLFMKLFFDKYSKDLQLNGGA